MNFFELAVNVKYRNSAWILCFCWQQMDTESLVGFNLSSYRSCKNLWKSCVEHHTFFRLCSPPTPKSSLFSLQSKFRYRCCSRPAHEALFIVKLFLFFGKGLQIVGKICCVIVCAFQYIHSYACAFVFAFTFGYTWLILMIFQWKNRIWNIRRGEEKSTNCSNFYTVGERQFMIYVYKCSMLNCCLSWWDKVRCALG